MTAKYEDNFVLSAHYLAHSGLGSKTAASRLSLLDSCFALYECST